MSSQRSQFPAPTRHFIKVGNAQPVSSTSTQVKKWRRGRDGTSGPLGPARPAGTLALLVRAHLGYSSK